MSKQLKYPQVMDLNIGQAINVPLAEVQSLPSLRVSMSELGKRHSMRFEVHVDRRSNVVEIARVSCDELPAPTYAITPAKRRGYLTKAERKVLMDEAWAKHLASFEDEDED